MSDEARLRPAAAAADLEPKGCKLFKLERCSSMATVRKRLFAPIKNGDALIL